MKAIAIKQPLAHFVVKGDKKIEYRSWRTNFRGQILIHASLKLAMNQEACDEYCEEKGFPVVDLKTLPRGGIVGYATIVDCVECPPSHRLSGLYGFVLENPGEVEFYPIKGKLSLWESDLEFV